MRQRDIGYLISGDTRSGMSESAPISPLISARDAISQRKEREEWLTWATSSPDAWPSSLQSVPGHTPDFPEHKT